MKKMALLKALIGFITLFACYHAAEYMLLFRNDPTGFFILSIVFFILAWLLAKWQGFTGLSAWGMVMNKQGAKQLLSGLLVGGCIYTLYTLTVLWLDIDRIKEVPPLSVFISQFFLFAIGTFLSSLSEDVLTRGYVFRFLHGKMSAVVLIAFSSILYLLNHIYRLQEGPMFWSYILIIGIFLMLAMVRTGNIWLTLGLHWAGNIVYHSTHSILHTVRGQGKFSGDLMYLFFLLLLIPVTYFISKKEPGQS